LGGVTAQPPASSISPIVTSFCNLSFFLCIRSYSSFTEARRCSSWRAPRSPITSTRRISLFRSASAAAASPRPTDRPCWYVHQYDARGVRMTEQKHDESKLERVIRKIKR